MKLSPKIQEIVNLANSLPFRNKYTIAERWTAYLHNGYLVDIQDHTFENYKLYWNICGDNANFIIENNRRFYVLK